VTGVSGKDLKTAIDRLSFGEHQLYNYENVSCNFNILNEVKVAFVFKSSAILWLNPLRRQIPRILPTNVT